MVGYSVFIIIGIVCGLAYAALGIAAAKYMHHSTYIDKYVGWSLWWFLEREKYSDRGKKYCTIGAIFAFSGGTSWVLYFVFP